MIEKEAFIRNKRKRRKTLYNVATVVQLCKPRLHAKDKNTA